MKKLKIFVASPQDVKEEKAYLLSVCDELNHTIGLCLDVEFEMLTAEKDSQPGRGVDAQDVINKSVPPDYQILIGVMGHRLGTPTKRASSGTVEEYERALSRSISDPKSVEIFFYFKKETGDLDEVDITQLDQVRKFKRKLKDDGIYYFSFSTLIELGSLVRVHLCRQTLIAINPKDEVSPMAQQPVVDYAKLIKEYNARFFDGAAILQKMSMLLEERTQKTKAITLKINQIVGLPEDKRLLNRMRLADQAALVYREFASKFKSEIPEMNAAFASGFRTMLNVISDPNFEDEEVGWRTLSRELSSLGVGIKNAYDVMERLSKADLYGISAALDWAMDLNRETFNEILHSLKNLQSLLTEASNLIDSKLV